MIRLDLDAMAFSCVPSFRTWLLQTSQECPMKQWRDGNCDYLGGQAGELEHHIT